MALPALAALPLLTKVGLGLNAAGALGGIGFGIAQSAQARRLERNNPLPLTSVNNNILQNVALAEQMQRVGLPSQVYNNQLNQMNTGLTAGLRLAARQGGTASIASTLRGFNSGVSNLNAQDAQARQGNQRLLMQQRGVLANEQQRVFDWNKANPYLRTMQRVASLRNAGTQNIFGGVGALSSMGTNLAMSEGAADGIASDPQNILNISGTNWNRLTGRPVGDWSNNMLGNMSLSGGRFFTGQ
jgi:hypothetical protein